MIDAVLNHVAAQLNLHFRHCFALAEDMVVVSNLQDGLGAPVPMADNKLVIFLSGVERDTIAHRAAGQGRGALGATSNLRASEPVFLNLLLMCAANFSGKSYTDALKFLSGAIAFLQSKPVFDRHNSPDFDQRIERLMLNIENLSAGDMQNLWSIHGGRYLPSVLYRVSLLGLDENAVRGRDPSIREIDLGSSA
jgi:hypothetical protein